MTKLSPGPWKWAIGVGAVLESASGLQGRTKRILEVKPGAIFDATQADLDAIARAPEMVGMLRKLEWSGMAWAAPDMYAPCCSSCGGMRSPHLSDNFKRPGGHAPGCDLAALLKELP